MGHKLGLNMFLYMKFYYYSNEVLCDYLKKCKGRFLYYVRVKGWMGGIAKYLLFLTGVGGWFGSSLHEKKREGLCG